MQTEWTGPESAQHVQRYFIRIIILIPNYALCSFFALVFEGASVYIQTARDMCGPARVTPAW